MARDTREDMEVVRPWFSKARIALATRLRFRVLRCRRWSMPQIQSDAQPVTQITIVEVGPGKQDEALSLMTERARFMSRQPGFVSISLHRSLDGRRIVNYIQWQSREQLQSAHKSPDFRKEWDRFDRLAGDIDPHLYEVVHVMDGA